MLAALAVSMSNTNEQQLLLHDFKNYLQQQEEPAESIFDLGWSMPNSKGLEEGMSDYISWREVEKFLLMAQESLRARERRAAELEERLLEKHQQLEQEQQEKSQVGACCRPQRVEFVLLVFNTVTL